MGLILTGFVDRQLLANGIRVRAGKYSVLFVDDCYGVEGTSGCSPSPLIAIAILALSLAIPLLPPSFIWID